MSGWKPTISLIHPPKRQAEKRKPPIFYVFGVTRSGIEPRPPAPLADALTTTLRGGGRLNNGRIPSVTLKQHNNVTQKAFYHSFDFLNYYPKSPKFNYNYISSLSCSVLLSSTIKASLYLLQYLKVTIALINPHYADINTNCCCTVQLLGIFDMTFRFSGVDSILSQTTQTHVHGICCSHSL